MFWRVRNYRFIITITIIIVVGCWHGYLSGARCRHAYGPADATDWFLPFWCRPTRVVQQKGPLNGCVCVCVCIIITIIITRHSQLSIPPGQWCWRRRSRVQKDDNRGSRGKPAGCWRQLSAPLPSPCWRAPVTAARSRNYHHEPLLPASVPTRSATCRCLCSTSARQYCQLLDTHLHNNIQYITGMYSQHVATAKR